MNEPIPSNDTIPDDLEPERPSASRVRSDLHGASWKLLLWLLLIALAPAVVLVSTSWTMADKVQSAHTGMVTAVSDLEQQAGRLAERVDSLEKKIEDSRTQQTLLAHQKLAEKSFQELVDILSAMISDKNAEDVSTDKKVKSSLLSSQEVFSEALIFDRESKKVIVIGSDKKPAPLAESFPELSQKYASGKTPQVYSEQDWHWTRLGRSAFVLAVQIAPRPRDMRPPNQPTPRPKATKTSLKELKTLGQAMNRRAWILLVVLPLITLALAAATFWWMRSGLLTPLRDLTSKARKMLEDPSSVRPEDFTDSGLLSDLSSSLARYQTRLRRLDQVEDDFDHTRIQLEKIREVLKEASHGFLGRRVEVEPGGCERLALECNLLLDSAAERLEGFQQVGSHLQTSAQRLTELSLKLAQATPIEESDSSLPDPAPLGDVLGVKLESLCQAANQMAEGVLKDAPESWVKSGNETHMNSLGNATTGLRVLVQRANETKSHSGHMSNLKQEVEVISTNLAIAAEAHSWNQVEKLIDQVHGLANNLADLSEALTRDLEQLVRSGVSVAESVETANQYYVNCIDRLLSWETLLESFHRHRSELLGLINVVRPAAGSLGADVRRLAEAYHKYRQTLTDKQETLRNVADGSSALAKTVDEMLRLLSRVETPKLAPATVTRNLADRQQALEHAIRDLTQLASEEGIQSLTPDASEILERIKSVAEEARKRIMEKPGASA